MNPNLTTTDPWFEGLIKRNTKMHKKVYFKYFLTINLGFLNLFGAKPYLKSTNVST